jgi:hypothetical protein
MGHWAGPDKVAHAFWCPALTFGAGWIWPDQVLVWWLLSLLGGLVWELSNYWFVFSGKRGISILDAVAFVGGWLVTGLVLWGAR